MYASLKDRKNDIRELSRLGLSRPGYEQGLASRVGIAHSCDW